MHGDWGGLFGNTRCPEPAFPGYDVVYGADFLLGAGAAISQQPVFSMDFLVSDGDAVFDDDPDVPFTGASLVGGGGGDRWDAEFYGFLCLVWWKDFPNGTVVSRANALGGAIVSVDDSTGLRRS